MKRDTVSRITLTEEDVYEAIEMFILDRTQGDVNLKLIPSQNLAIKFTPNESRTKSGAIIQVFP